MTLALAGIVHIIGPEQGFTVRRPIVPFQIVANNVPVARNYLCMR
jgi:hypothetical protein